MTSSDRVVGWDGLINGRDVGGLAAGRRGPIADGRLIRSASVHHLTALGWEQLVAAGVRTVIDLRSSWEVAREPVPPEAVPDVVTRRPIPLEPDDYMASWADRPDRWKVGTPLYYEEFLADHATRVGGVLAAVASADEGGVLVHCAGGRDRTGLVVAMALDLVDVDHDDIIDDHWQSFDRERPLEEELGHEVDPARPTLDRPGHRAALGAVLDGHGAVDCFGDLRTAATVRGRLLDRLLG